MNEFLPEKFSENISRLALGLLPIDAELGTILAHPVRITFDGVPAGLNRPPVVRHNSCRHALLFDPSFTDQVDLRILDKTRRVTPRRLRIPLRPLPQADAKPYTDRVRRLVLFPGAAYDVASLATALRGRVLRGGAPMRWARVVAVTPGSNDVVARAHGDDRGEFLMLLGSGAAPVTDTDTVLNFEVQIWGPQNVPVPATPDLPKKDALWDLPLEKPLSLGGLDPVDADDPMFAGLTMPDTYVLLTSAIVGFQLGRVVSLVFSI